MPQKKRKLIRTCVLWPFQENLIQTIYEKTPTSFCSVEPMFMTRPTQSEWTSIVWFSTALIVAIGRMDTQSDLLLQNWWSRDWSHARCWAITTNWQTDCWLLTIGVHFFCWVRGCFVHQADEQENKDRLMLNYKWQLVSSDQRHPCQEPLYDRSRAIITSYPTLCKYTWCKIRDTLNEWVIVVHKWHGFRAIRRGWMAR